MTCRLTKTRNRRSQLLCCAYNSTRTVTLHRTGPRWAAHQVRRKASPVTAIGPSACSAQIEQDSLVNKILPKRRFCSPSALLLFKNTSAGGIPQGRGLPRTEISCVPPLKGGHTFTSTARQRPMINRVHISSQGAQLQQTPPRSRRCFVHFFFQTSHAASCLGRCHHAQ